MAKSLKSYAAAHEALSSLGACTHFVERERGKTCLASWNAIRDPVDLFWMAVKVADSKEEEQLILATLLALLKSDTVLASSSSLLAAIAVAEDHINSPTDSTRTLVAAKVREVECSKEEDLPAFSALRESVHEALCAVGAEARLRMDMIARSVNYLAQAVAVRTHTSPLDARATFVTLVRDALSFVSASF
jgi:hypothetical protein